MDRRVYLSVLSRHVRLLFAMALALSMFLGPAQSHVAKADDVGLNNPPELALDLLSLKIAEGQNAMNTGTAGDPDSDALTLSASIGSITDHQDGTWTWSYASEDGPGDSQIVTIRADDGNGGVTEVVFDLVVDNVAPTAVFVSSGPVSEGQPFSLALSNPADPSVIDAHAGFEYAFDCGDGAGYGVFSTSSTATCPTLYDGIRSVGSQIRDKDGGIREYTASVIISNSVPVLGPLVLPSDPVLAGTTIQFTAVFTDPPDYPLPPLPEPVPPCYPNCDTVYWEWGDGSADTVDQATSPTTIAHTYTAPGVYTIALTVTDIDGDVVTGTYDYVVVYDPEGGFVTGGGWIDSPGGAYLADPNLVGKASFGFVSRYKKGASTPTGNTEFQFKVGDLEFHSSSYDWLVVTGSNYAKFKGRGMINGSLAPNGEPYSFKIWAGDGTGPGGADTFRIKIWYEEGGTVFLVYDNGMDQAIGGGNIVGHE